LQQIVKQAYQTQTEDFAIVNHCHVFGITAAQDGAGSVGIDKKPSEEKDQEEDRLRDPRKNVDGRGIEKAQAADASLTFREEEKRKKQ
jgi:hypothetical protein